MTRQLESYCRLVEHMDDGELSLMIEGIKRRKYEERPATEARRKREAAPKANANVARVERLLAKLPAGQVEALLAEMGEVS